MLRTPNKQTEYLNKATLCGILWYLCQNTTRSYVDISTTRRRRRHRGASIRGIRSVLCRAHASRPSRIQDTPVGLQATSEFVQNPQYADRLGRWGRRFWSEEARSLCSVGAARERAFFKNVVTRCLLVTAVFILRALRAVPITSLRFSFERSEKFSLHSNQKKALLNYLIRSRGLKLLLGGLAVLTIALIAFTPAPKGTEAAVSFNQKVNFQGRLTDSNGNVVPDGTYNIEFKLMSVSTGGDVTQGSCTTSCVWLESRTGANKVTVSRGLFSVQLGSVTAISSVNWNQELYLSVRVGGTAATPTWDPEMSPRHQLGMAPTAAFAGLADNANNLNGQAASYYQNASNLNAGTLADARLTSNVALLNRAAQTFTGNGNYFTGGNVGIGTASPGSLLHLNSATTTTTTVGQKDARIILQNASTTLNGGGEVILGAAADTATGRYAAIGTDIKGNSLGDASGDVYIATKTLTTDTTLTRRLVIQANGNVGIGNAAPGYKLDVTGDINSSTALRVGGVSVCTSSGCTSSSGSGSYIQNTTSPQSGANFNIGGNGVIGGTLAVTGATTLTGQLNANGGIVTGNTAVNAGTGTITGGTGAFSGAVTGTTINGTTGINTGAGAGTQRIDASGNLVNIGTITSGLINGQTISSAAKFTGTLTTAGDVETTGNINAANGGIGQFQNLVTSSETIAGTGWLNAGTITSTQNAIVAPDGNTTATQLTQSGTTSNSYTRASFTNTVAGPYTVSVWAKAGSLSQIQYGMFDFTTSTWLTQPTTTLTSGWQRLSATGTPAATGHSIGFLMYVGTSGNVTAGSYIYVWGAQLVTGSSPLVYNKTSGTANATLQGGVVSNGAFFQTAAGANNYLAGDLTLGTLGTGGTTLLCSNGGQISTCSGGAGSGNYIQNTTSPQSGANFNISGNGVIGGTLAVTGASTLTGQLNANGGIVTNNTAVNAGTGTITGGTGTFSGAVTGTTLNGTTGINTGAGAGTQRLDASGNLVNINSIKSQSGLTSNLVLDPQFANIPAYWGNVAGVAQSNERLDNGDIVNGLQINTTTNIQAISDYVPVNPYKTYRFSLWVKENNTDSTLYMGLHTYNVTKGNINNYNSAGTGSTNNYFWSGDAPATNTWVRRVGYLLPCNTANGWTNPPDTTSINFRMDCTTAYARTRFLNYDGAGYGTGAGTDARFALPSIEEVQESSPAFSLNNSDYIIQPAGNVGIGTTNPGAYKLNVAGTVKATGSIDTDVQFLGQAADSAAAPSFSFTTDTNTGIFQPSADVLGITTGGAERLRVDSGGNVGIGTTSPGYKLDVTGDINSSTALRVGGVSVCTSSGCTSSSGSGNYIQNTTSPQSGANFNISGNGTIGGTLAVTGAITGSSTVTGTTINGTTGINTGAGAGTNRIDASGNLVNIGTIASGLINGQTISSAANFTGTLNVATSLSVGGTGVITSGGNDVYANIRVLRSQSSLADGMYINYGGSGGSAKIYDGGTTNYVNIGAGGVLTAPSNINTTSGGIQTAGTTRVDNAGNLTNIGTISSGAINGQTISSSANFTGTLSVAGNLTSTGRQLTLSNFKPEYRWRFGGGADLNWKKIADVTIAGANIYAGANFQVDVLDDNTNLGGSSAAIPLRYYVSALRSSGVQDSPNNGTVSGPIADYVRLVKTSTGVYELQVRQTVNYRNMDVTARLLSDNNTATVTYIDNPADGSTTGTNYTPSVTGYTQNFANANVNGNFLTGGTQRIDAAGNLSNIGTINGQTVSSAANFTGTVVAGSTIQGTQLISTVATGTAPITVASSTLVSNLNSNYLGGFTENQIAENLRAQANLSGGGTVSWTSGNLSWNQRFIVISNSTSYTDIAMPAVGTVITGVGGAANVTVTASGIPLPGWQALYYVPATSTYRVASYTSGSINSTPGWVLIGVYNADNGSLRLGTGLTLLSGQTSTNGAVNNAQFNTSVSTPLVQNAGNLTLAATGANALLLQTNGSTRLTLDSSGNATFTGTISSGTVNGQTISSAASFTGTVNAVTGYKVNGAATAGNYLRGDGTNFVSSTLQAADLTGTVASARLSGSYTGITGTGALSAGSIASGFGTIVTGNTITGTTLNGTTGINTGVGAGTQRIDSSGNLVNIGTATTTGNVNVGKLSAPGSVSATTFYFTGSLVTGTYSYTVVAEDAGYNTTPASASAQCYVDNANQQYGCSVSWGSVTGATRYRVYRNNAEYFISYATSLDDYGYGGGTAGSAPTTNNTTVTRLGINSSADTFIQGLSFVIHTPLYGLSTSWNGAQAIAYVGKDVGTNRSINAAGSINASGADYAEWIPWTGAKPEAGSLIHYKGTTMVVSSKETAAFVANDGFKGEAILVAFAGQVPVKVTGPAKEGDYLVDNNDGTAKAVSQEKATNQERDHALGIAWETKAETGVKPVLAALGLKGTLGRAAPDSRNGSADTLSANALTAGKVQGTEGDFSTLNVTNKATIAELKVTGKATLASAEITELKVTGLATIQTLVVTGDAEIKGNLKADKDAEVGGKSKLKDDVTAEKNARVNGSLKVDDDLALGSDSKGINVSIDKDATTKQMTFKTPQPDSSYAVQITPQWDTKAWVSDKTAEGFVIHFTPAPETARLDWIITR